MAPRNVITTRCHNDVFGIDQAFTRLEPVAIHDGRQSRDGDPFA